MCLPKTLSTGAAVACISKWRELQKHMCGTHLRTQAGLGSHTNPTVADYARPNPTVADHHGPNIKQFNFHFLSTPTPCKGGWGRQNVEAALGKLHVVALHPGARASDVPLLLLLACPPGSSLASSASIPSISFESLYPLPTLSANGRRSQLSILRADSTPPLLSSVLLLLPLRPSLSSFPYLFFHLRLVSLTL